MIVRHRRKTRVRRRRCLSRALRGRLQTILVSCLNSAGVSGRDAPGVSSGKAEASWAPVADKCTQMDCSIPGESAEGGGGTVPDSPLSQGVANPSELGVADPSEAYAHSSQLVRAHTCLGDALEAQDADSWVALEAEPEPTCSSSFGFAAALADAPIYLAPTARRPGCDASTGRMHPAAVALSTGEDTLSWAGQGHGSAPAPGYQGSTSLFPTSAWGRTPSEVSPLAHRPIPAPTFGCARATP